MMVLYFVFSSFLTKSEYFGVFMRKIDDAIPAKRLNVDGSQNIIIAGSNNKIEAQR